MSIKMPEPVAYLVDWPDEIELGLYFSEEKNDHARSRPLITAEQAEAYAKAVRDDALDKAADLVGGSSMTSRHAAAAIRALKRDQS